MEFQEHDLKIKVKQTGEALSWPWSKFGAIVVRSLYDALLHLLCSTSGFLALSFAASIFNRLPNVYDTPGGTGALLVFLIILGLLGVSGQLPYVIQLGKVPK